MPNLTPIPELSDVPLLEISTPALGGVGGPMNAQAQALLNRLQFLIERFANNDDATDNAGMLYQNIALAYNDFTVGEKLNRTPFLTDFPGATADLKFSAALAQGVPFLRIPYGQHTITSWVVSEASSLQGLVFDPGAELIVTAALNRIGLDIQQTHFRVHGELRMTSTGTAGDALNTTGIRHGTNAAGKAFLEIDAVRIEGFSNRGFVSYQTVFTQIGSAKVFGEAGADSYGLSFEPTTAPLGATTVQIGRAYVTGQRRGINVDTASWFQIDMPIAEYCGHATDPDGALHFKNVARSIVNNRYGELNERNMVLDDATIVWGGGQDQMFAATAPDIVSYTGVAAGDRGQLQLSSKGINARRIGADTIDEEDLLIGENLTVPFAAGSVRFGAETMLSATGTLTSATWTTVYTFTADELNGASVSNRALFEYVAAAGTADLSTGFDAGTIYNNTLRSYSGSTPAWLRLSGNTLQMNVVSSSYGLNYSVALRRVAAV